MTIQLPSFVVAGSSAVGAAVLAVLVSLLTGKTFKTLLLYPFQKWAAKNTDKTLGDKLVEEAEKDLGVDPLPPPTQGKQNG